MSDTPNQGGYPPQPGYPPTQPGSAAPPPKGSSKTGWIVVGILAVVLIAGAAVLVPMILDDDTTTDTQSAVGAVTTDPSVVTAAPATTVAATIAPEPTSTPTTAAPANTVASSTPVNSVTIELPALADGYIEAANRLFRFELPTEFADSPAGTDDFFVGLGGAADLDTPDLSQPFLSVGTRKNSSVEAETSIEMEFNAPCAPTTSEFSAGPLTGNVIVLDGCSPQSRVYLFETPVRTFRVQSTSTTAVEEVLSTLEIYPQVLEETP